ncbi:MAG: hypothetical protein AUI47_07050 [Acidobacteria bacterium 13_1_40CM_2_68_5]|nr:MAG: hypothetical protein AUI47_07050 [Acidobacteria bacterium 13_1_40CM_2_68_5]
MYSVDPVSTIRTAVSLHASTASSRARDGSRSLPPERTAVSLAAALERSVAQPPRRDLDETVQQEPVPAVRDAPAVLPDLVGLEELPPVEQRGSFFERPDDGRFQARPLAGGARADRWLIEAGRKRL